MLALLALALACGEADRPAEPPAAAPAAPAPSAAPSAPAAAPADSLARPATDPAAYGDTVLVILSSDLQPGVEPPGLATAAALPGARPVRLDSSAYKNLMPCYEIVVAGAFTDKAEARALSAALKAAGVDHYLKPAGAYVGARPELEAACAARRAPPEPSQQVGFVDAVGLRLPLDPAVAERALQDAPAVRPLSESFDAWAATLPVRTVDRWSKGQAVTGLRYDTGVVECTIQDLVVGVTGTPHFGATMEGPLSKPACGEPAAYAALDCTADLVLLGEGEPRVGVWTGPEVALAEAPALPAAWKDTVGWALQAGETVARGSGAELKVRWTARPLRLGEAEARLVQLTVETGEGEWFCGGEDHHQVLAGVLTADGRAQGPLHDLSTGQVQGVVGLGAGAPSLHLLDVITGSQRLVGPQLQAELSQAYCDCPC